MLIGQYQYKRILKSSIGKRLDYHETSVFGPEYRKDGVLIVAGPSPCKIKWFAEVTMREGFIESVR